MINLIDIVLTDHDKWVCEQWLAKWTNINKSIEQLNISYLERLIAYEMNTRKRIKVIDRLLGRYFKLLRKSTTNDVVNYMDGTYYDKAS